MRCGHCQEWWWDGGDVNRGAVGKWPEGEVTMKMSIEGLSGVFGS